MQPWQAVSLGGTDHIIKIREITPRAHWRAQLGDAAEEMGTVGLERGVRQLRAEPERYSRGQDGVKPGGVQQARGTHPRFIGGPGRLYPRHRLRGERGLECRGRRDAGQARGRGRGARRWLCDRGRGWFPSSSRSSPGPAPPWADLRVTARRSRGATKSAPESSATPPALTPPLPRLYPLPAPPLCRPAYAHVCARCAGLLGTHAGQTGLQSAQAPGRGAAGIKEALDRLRRRGGEGAESEAPEALSFGGLESPPPAPC